jgi:diadenosine tetraphosphate (Ap4A) HIT family hydrolase
MTEPNTDQTPSVQTDLERAQRNEIAPWVNPVTEDQHVAVFMDKYPVTTGHRLYVPKWDTDYGIWYAFRFAQEHGDNLRKQGEIDGYNIGINRGIAAGQTVLYPHVHFIPRMSGDCADATGGVRGVIPGQANYRSATYQKP